MTSTPAPRLMERMLLLATLLAVAAIPDSLIAAQAHSERRVTIGHDGWRLIGDLTLPARAGRAGPAVLLLNGAGTDRQDYRRLSARLADRGVISLRLDLRASGESVNRGRFVPFDSTGQNDALGLDRTWTDVRAALRFLIRQPAVDARRVGALGASYSGEALARAMRGWPVVCAVAFLSPGSFSDTSLADVDRRGRAALFVYSAKEMIVRRYDMARWTRRGSQTARVLVLPDSAHASRLLAASPHLDDRLAEWFSRTLSTESNNRPWRAAADRVAAPLETGVDDLRRPGEATADLADGEAGRLLFFLARYQAFRNTSSLAAVHRSARRLTALISPRIDSLEPNLYRGAAGILTSLLDAAELTRDSSHRREAVKLADHLRRLGRSDAAGTTWGPANDIAFGDAGVALALNAAGARLGDSSLVRLAIENARVLLQRSRPDSAGSNWFRSEQTPHYVLPNFSHGAAGIGTALAIMARAQASPSELHEAAAGAARYLVSIARRDTAGLRIPYGWPVPAGGWSRPFDASWAHGQAGTARLFWELWQATRDASFLGLVEQAVAGLDAAGLVGSPHPDYGAEPFSFEYRFGLTGIADFFADLYDETGDRRHLERALGLAREILTRAVPVRGGIGWKVSRWPFMEHAGEPAVFTGFWHGAAGPGLLFLKLDALLRGRRPPTPLPDSPFGEW